MRKRKHGLTQCSYFATYELLKQKLSPPAPIVPGTGEKAAAPPLSIGAVMLAGGTAGVAMWSVAIPPDVRPLSSVPCPALHLPLSPSISMYLPRV